MEENESLFLDVYGGEIVLELNPLLEYRLVPELLPTLDVEVYFFPSLSEEFLPGASTCLHEDGLLSALFPRPRVSWLLLMPFVAKRDESPVESKEVEESSFVLRNAFCSSFKNSR